MPTASYKKMINENEDHTLSCVNNSSLIRRVVENMSFWVMV